MGLVTPFDTISTDQFRDMPRCRQAIREVLGIVEMVSAVRLIARLSI